MAGETREQIIKTWMQRATKQVSSCKPGLGLKAKMFYADLLISCWISFEAYTCMQYSLSRVGQRNSAFINQHKNWFHTEWVKLPDALREALNYLHNKPVKDMTPNMPPNPKIIIDTKNLEEVINVIYRIRCNLFHGGKEIDMSPDKEYIENAAIILYYLLSAILHKEHLL